MPEYRLLREHKLNKVWRQIGDEVSLPEQIGEWLVSQAIAARIDGYSPRTASAPVMPARAPRAQFTLATPRFKCCGWK